MTDVNIDNANAKDASPLAIATTSTKAYLYYVDGHDQLQKIVKSDITNAESWGQAQNVSGKKVHKESQITVISAGGKNHLFYVAQGMAKTTFEHVIDSQ